MLVIAACLTHRVTERIVSIDKGQKAAVGADTCRQEGSHPHS